MTRSRLVFGFLLLLLICILFRELTAYWGLIHGFFQIARNKDGQDNNSNDMPINTNTLLRQEKKSLYNQFQHSSSLDFWSPFKVNESCPIFAIESDHGNDGFGDQFERYAHLLNIARLLRATAVPTFSNNSGHVGSHEYIKLAQLMNINMDLHDEYTKYNISHHFSFSLDEVEKIHAEIMSNKNGSSHRLPCHSVVRVTMFDCNGSWCPFVLKEIHEVKWILKNNFFSSYCAKHKVGFKRERGRVNVLWHVRSGDLCIRCKDTSYFDALLQLIVAAVQSRAKTVLHIESGSNLSELVEHYGGRSTFFIHRPIIETVCRMLTTDILITSGSSLAYVAAISKGQLPLVMEEMRKEALPQFSHIWGGGAAIRESLHHVFNEDEAVLLRNGRPIVPEWKFKHRLVATLSDLFIEDRR